MTASATFASIDLDAMGRRVGVIQSANPSDRSAYGISRTPIAVFHNGQGPTVLLTAGVHGDELEGQLVLGELIRNLKLAAVRGRLIIAPSLNGPAVAAGRRFSPVDGGNLMRAFGANAPEGPTASIAAFVEKELLSRADYHLDIHTGGLSLDYVPLTGVVLSGDPALDAAALQAARAFGAGWLVHWQGFSAPHFFAAAARRKGCVSFNGEFGGGAGLSVLGLEVLRDGLARLLRFWGVYEGAATAAAPPVELDGPIPKNFVWAEQEGVFVPNASLGAWVEAGDLCGHVVSLPQVEAAPMPYHFSAGGLVVCRRATARVGPGDCLAHTAGRLLIGAAS